MFAHHPPHRVYPDRHASKEGRRKQRPKCDNNKEDDVSHSVDNIIMQNVRDYFYDY